MEDIGASLPQRHSKQVFVRVITTIPSCHPGLGQDDPGHNQRPNPGLPGRVRLHSPVPLSTSQVSAASDNMGHPETLLIGLIPKLTENYTWRAETRRGLEGESLY